MGAADVGGGGLGGFGRDVIKRGADKYVSALRELALSREPSLDEADSAPRSLSRPVAALLERRASESRSPAPLALPAEYLTGGGSLEGSLASSPATRPSASCTKEALLKAALLTSFSDRPFARSGTASRAGSSNDLRLSRSPSFGSASPRVLALDSHDSRHHWP